MELFAKIVNDWKPIVLANSTILQIWQGSEYASGTSSSRERDSRWLTTQKMKFSVKDSFSKCDQIRRKLRIWSHFLKKPLMENVKKYI